MKTFVWTVDKNVENIKSYPQIQQAAELLGKNEVVAFPTETVYGLGGNALSDGAISKIFEAKGRPSDNPLIIHIAEISQLHDFVQKVPAKAELLMETFWPGPLTIIFEKKQGMLSELATAGLSTVGVRMPDHPVALALIETAGLPIAAPSANLSGRPSPTTAQHVVDDLDGRVAGVVDGGATGVGLESTVIDCTEQIPVILRPGGITEEQLKRVLGEVMVDPAIADAQLKPKSPGMKYRHYAPDAPFYLVDGRRDFIQTLVDENRQKGLKVGVLTTEEARSAYDADKVIACGQRSNLETVAEALYQTLREFNQSGLDIIFSEIFPSSGVGVAVMNRLTKASGQEVIKEN